MAHANQQYSTIWLAAGQDPPPEWSLDGDVRLVGPGGAAAHNRAREAAIRAGESPDRLPAEQQEEQDGDATQRPDAQESPDQEKDATDAPAKEADGPGASTRRTNQSAANSGQTSDQTQADEKTTRRGRSSR